jgi:hypothetical protein
MNGASINSNLNNKNLLFEDIEEVKNPIEEEQSKDDSSESDLESDDSSDEEEKEL